MALGYSHFVFFHLRSGFSEGRLTIAMCHEFIGFGGVANQTAPISPGKRAQETEEMGNSSRRLKWSNKIGKMKRQSLLHDSQFGRHHFLEFSKLNSERLQI